MSRPNKVGVVEAALVKSVYNLSPDQAVAIKEGLSKKSILELD